MKGAIVTIGNFDGVHRGHQFMLRQVVERARPLGLHSVAVTFEPHPQAVLHPERPLLSLCDPDEKCWLIRRLGIDDVWVCPFTREMSQLSPEAFMRQVADRQPIAEIWIGTDFALGQGRSGTVAVLAEIGRTEGWGLHVVPPYMLDGAVVSSTRIRGFLAAGDVQAAAKLLGRPYAICGDLEFTTRGSLALRTPRRRAVPASGIYAARVYRGEVSFDAVAAVRSLDYVTQAENLVCIEPLGKPPNTGRVSLAFVQLMRLSSNEGEQKPLDRATASDRAAARSVLAETVQLDSERAPC
jgi:riboflavin kinase/FMN adenylyltransferase